MKIAELLSRNVYPFTSSDQGLQIPSSQQSQRQYFHYCSICFMFSAVRFLNVLILTLLRVLLFNLVKLYELPPVWERAANSAYHLLFRCLLRYVCSSFPLMFRTSFGF